MTTLRYKLPANPRSSSARDRRCRTAFTIIELLMVVLIITILFGILLSGIRTVQRHTLQTISLAEVRNIENAWKQYFAHYQVWPDDDVISGAPTLPDRDGTQHRITPVMAQALQGITNHPWAASWNHDGIVFMEFSRFVIEPGNANEHRMPVNAWGARPHYPREQCAYYVCFDTEGRNEIAFDPFADLTGAASMTTNLYRDVAVWSFNPEIKDRQGRPRLLGSWQ